jgi:hypothetical protein
MQNRTSRPCWARALISRPHRVERRHGSIGEAGRARIEDGHALLEDAVPVENKNG